REPHPTLLAAAQLVRIEVEVGVRQADRGEDRPHLLLALGPREPRVDLERLVQRVDDFPARIERGARVLIDVLEVSGDGAPWARRRDGGSARHGPGRARGAAAGPPGTPRWRTRSAGESGSPRAGR